MSETVQVRTRRRAAAKSGPRPEQVHELLSSIISGQIVPGLLTANRPIGGAETDADLWRGGGFGAERAARDVGLVADRIRASDVLRFVRLLRGGTVDAAAAFVEILLERGISRQSIYLDLLAPAARTIGAMWGDDECSFADVTMVVGRLHHIVKGFGEAGRVANLAPDAPLILLSPAPGEQHVFALDIVSAFFAEGGWRTELSHTDDAEEIIERAALRPYDAVGLTLARSDAVGVLAATILRIRAAAMNPDMLVLVGGPVFDANPAMAALVGADMLSEPGVRGAVAARQMLKARELPTLRS